jgi:3',5'-cyclic-AMP phosphodiesterase
VRIVALDTVVPQQAGGLFCAEREAWLEATLAAAPDRPTLLMMHHPPFRTGIGHMDEMGLEGADRFAALLRRHPQVGRVVCGHLHRPIATVIGSALVSTCPSVAHQVALDLRGGAPARFRMEPPGYQLHLWSDADGWISHTGVIGDYAGPYPFSDDGKPTG